MKKTLSICLTIVLVFGMVACLAGCGGGKDTAGKYDLVSMEQNGVKLTMDDLKDMAKAMGQDVGELNFYLELKDDGTGQVVLPDGSTDLTWDDKNITANGEAVPYTLKDGAITIEDAGIIAIFEK